MKALAPAALLVTALTPITAFAEQGWGIRSPDYNYSAVIQQVTQMPFDGDLQARTARYGLGVVNLTWEDTGRDLGSSVGPNISDLTLQVRETVDGGTRTHLLPVIRHPNFTDKTADLAADKLWVRVGNQSGNGKTAVPLTEVLKNLKEYLHDPGSLIGDGDFLADRDSHFLVSAQHVFLPIPKTGKAEFNPVLFNYQSSPGQPAVLTLLVTRDGTSATIIDNNGGDQTYQGWGQQLFFNNNGQKTVFTAERKSDVKARIERGEARPEDQGALEEGADMMMIVQVPLVHRTAHRSFGYGADAYDDAPAAEMAPAPTAGAMMKAERRGGSDVEQAVLGHGQDLGPYREMGGLRLVRDERFPVRVTVQFYKATSNGIVSDQDLAAVNDSIAKVYANGDYVGSLVVPERDRPRPTMWKRPATAVGFWRW
jgi:hypothetical protein